MLDVDWRGSFEDLNHLRSPEPVYARPAGLGSLGGGSYIIEPYKILSPHRVHIGNDVLIAERVVLSVVEEYNGEQFDSVLRIGDGTVLGPDLHLHCAGEIEIGSYVGISSRVFIGDSFRKYDDPDQVPFDMPMADPSPVRIRDGAVVGLGSIVLPGVTIGERALVSAGSVVTRDVPPRAVVFGNPARIVRSWDEQTGEWRAGP